MSKNGLTQSQALELVSTLDLTGMTLCTILPFDGKDGKTCDAIMGLLRCVRDTLANEYDISFDSQEVLKATHFSPRMVAESMLRNLDLANEDDLL